MRQLLSYINSHMYDIHALVAGFIVVAVMMYIKAPRKKMIRTLLVFLLSMVSFWALSVVSPFVSFSWQSSVITGVFALCIEAVLEQISEPDVDEN